MPSSRGGGWYAVLGVAVAMGAAAAPLDAQASAEDRRGATAAAHVLDRYAPALDGVDTRAEIVELGHSLFRDVRLSRDGTLSCAGCHRPERAFSDSGRVALGVDGRTGPRNVPAIINRAWGRSFSWDGRAKTLLEQVLLPIENPLELDLPVRDALDRLTRDAPTVEAFREAFGGGPTRERLANALAVYVASIRSDDAPFDRHFLGDTLALGPEEREGRRLFLGRAGCRQCHLGPNLTDEAFHVTGVAWRAGSPDDPGRAAVTGDSTQVGAFKTPTLREVARTAPYMHDGSIATLEDVIDFYDDGGFANPYLDEKIRPLGLTDEQKGALASFLRSLSGHVRDGAGKDARSPLVPR